MESADIQKLDEVVISLASTVLSNIEQAIDKENEFSPHEEPVFGEKQ